MALIDILSKTKDSYLTDECLEKVLKGKIDSSFDLKGLMLDGDLHTRDSYVSPEEITTIRLDLLRFMLKSSLNSGIEKDALSEIKKWWKTNESITSITIDDIKNLLSLNNEDLYAICNAGTQFENQPVVALGKYLFSHCCDFGFEHNGRDPLYSVEKQMNDREHSSEMSITNAYTKRIYMNIPEGVNKYKFLQLYIQKCVEKNIPFEMKAIVPDAGLDKTVLYSNDFYLNDHIDIINDIIENNKDIAESIGTPISYGGRVENEDGRVFYAISSGNPSRIAHHTQSSFIESTTNRAFLSLCAGVIKKYPHLIDNKNFQILDIEKISSLSALETEEIIEWCKTFKPGKTKTDERSTKLRNDFDKLQVGGIEVINQLIKSNPEHLTELVDEFRENIKIIASVARFEDKEHIDTPLFLDDCFLNLIQKEKNSKLEAEVNVSYEPNIDEVTTYLYNTEQLFAGVLQEFSESTLSSKDKAVNYINRVKEIETKYRYYAVHTPGFVGTDRYKEVHEHLKTVPRFEHYQPDPTKGNGINMVLANRYYDEVANAINDHIGESSKKNSETK